MGCSRRSLEGSDAESNVDCRDLACEVSGEISLLVIAIHFGKEYGYFLLLA